MATNTVRSHQASSLARRVFSLEEPWRSRFLDLIVDRVSLSRAAEPMMDRATVAIWLEDQQLYQQVSQLMRTWTHAKS
jgi:hypothetical protein